MFANFIFYFYEKTVKKLSVEEKDRYHQENMIAAGLVLVDTKEMPQTHDELKDWVISKSREKDYLNNYRCCRGCKRYYCRRPVPRHIKPIWPFIAFTAFQTLPQEFKDIYGIKTSKFKRVDSKSKPWNA